VPPPPGPPSLTSQPNNTKNPAPQSDALLNTLERLRALQKQTQPPRSRPNPTAGGAPNGGGNPLGSDTSQLSASQVGAIGAHVRECWTYDSGALGADKFVVRLRVTTDDTGMARVADIAGEDVGRMGDPRFRAFAERARRAVLAPHCSDLSKLLPASMRDRQATLDFRFSP